MIDMCYKKYYDRFYASISYFVEANYVGSFPELVS